MFFLARFFIFLMILIYGSSDESVQIVEDGEESNSTLTGFKLENIKGVVKFLEVDSESNIYVATMLSGFSQTWGFYKLNAKKSFVIENQNLQNIQKVIIASDVIYIFCAPYGISLYRLEPDSTEIKKIYEFLQYPAPAVYFTDHDGNVIFNTAHGVAILKNAETTPKGIINLENFYITDDSTHAVDTENNIYLCGTIEYTLPKIAIVTAEEIKSFAPKASLHDYESNPISYFGKTVYAIPQSIMPDDKGHVILKYNGNQARISMTGGSWNPNILLSQYYTDFNILKLKKDHKLKKDVIYYFSRNIYNNECQLYLGYMENGDMYKAKKVDKMFESSFCSRCLTAFDGDGNMYLASDSELYHLNVEKLKIKKINFPSKSKIIGMKTDQDDDLWVLGNDLFVIQGDDLKQVTNSTMSKTTAMLKINRQEIIVGSDKGLYIISKN